MPHTSRQWRLFSLVLCLILPAHCHAQTPALTTVSDIVYRADGAAATGTLLISWPGFTTSDGHAVAAGNKSVVLGSDGSFRVQLVPNAGAAPSSVLYSVVYQLSDGTVKTESWSVGTVSPESIAQVRTASAITPSGNTPFATQAYVNAAMANVVHLSGSETITGTKQFAVSPILPAATQSGQAVNKGYVDTAVVNTGSGNFVARAGDTMTGPLTLPADPVAPNQASTRHYVDVNAAMKADLIGGTVPTGELGIGIANNGACLHGDSTWGGCGAANGLTPGMQAIKYATDFAWTQINTADLSTAGAKTVTLVACPVGVSGTEPQYYIYVSGTGTAEAVLVTGGTCAGSNQPGTLQFTTANPHVSGYTIGSASGGLQEALVAARFVPSNPGATSQSGKVVVPPGEMKAYARVSIRGSNITVDFSGSIIECWMNDSCIVVGDLSNSSLFQDITLLNPRGRPTVAGGQKPFLEINAQKTRVVNASTRVGYAGGTFGTYVQVDDDQAFTLDGLDTTLGGGLRCDSTFCGPAVYAPGPFNTYSAVGWLKNLNISLQCGGNGVDWESGNTLRIADSVIQGYAQYGVRSGTRRGGYGATELDNVYEEVGNCQNPAGNIGEAGVVLQGNSIKIESGTAPAGSVPLFANTGSTDYRYYIVPHHATYGAGNPLYVGRALTNNTGNITVTVPDIAGASTLDLLRVGVSGMEQAPFGTDNFAVSANVSRATACDNGICTFTDTQAALQSYTVATPTYFPLLTYWPGNLVLGSNSDSGSTLAGARAWMQNMAGNIVSVSGMVQPSAISTSCDAVTGWTPIWLSCFSAMAPTTFYQQGALLIAVKPNNDANGTLNLKGRLNFSTLGSGPGHIVTLSDSNFQKTIATQNNRPTNDQNDSFIGYDQGDGNPAHIGISFGAPVSVSNYIGNAGDGTNWLERLTGTLKEFKTNVKMDSGLTVSGTIQANSFVSSGSGPWTLQGNFGTLSPAPAGQSIIGFGPNGALQTSTNGGALQTLATLTSSITGNAGTATAFDHTPTQCSGFVTGIQANGNANCASGSSLAFPLGTATVSASGYGQFGFDTAGLWYSSNAGSVVHVGNGPSNLFNQDTDGSGGGPANVLEEASGTTPQALRIYGSRTDATHYSRLSLSWDAANGAWNVASQAGSAGGTAGSLEFSIASAPKWNISASSPNAFAPNANNVYDIGNSSFEPRDIYVGRNLILSAVAASSTLCTDGTKNVTTAGCATAGMVYPGPGIPVSTGGTWGTSLTAPASALVGILDAQTLTNKTVDGVSPATFGYLDATSSIQTQLNALMPKSGGTFTGAITVNGSVTASSFISNGSGPWQVTGSYGTLTAPGTSRSAIGFGASGHLQFALSGSSTFNDLAIGQGCGGHNWLSAVDQTGASGNCTQPTYSDIGGSVPTWNQSTTGTAANLTAAAALPNGTTATTQSTHDNSTKLATTAYADALGCAMWYSQSTAQTGTPVAFPTTANKAFLMGMNFTCQLPTTQFTYDVVAADNTTNNYDIGLYSNSGSLVAHLGATTGTAFASSTGWKTLPWAAGATLQPGRYYLLITTNCSSSCATLAGGPTGGGLTFNANNTFSITTGGSLPASITPPSDSWTATTLASVVIR